MSELQSDEFKLDHDFPPKNIASSLPNNIDKDEKTQDELLEVISSRFGIPKIDYFGSQSWRVWILNHHVHDSSFSHGSFASGGKSLKEAAERLLEIADKHTVIPSGDCSRFCPHYDDSID